MTTHSIVAQADALRKKGLRVVPIVANERRPAVKWRDPALDWQTCLKAWESGIADRIGIIHSHGWLCIDIDGDKQTGEKLRGATPLIAEAMLKALNLPNDYAWTGASQSGTGWHIWVIAPDADADGIKREIWFIKTLGYHHDIELRYAGHYTTLPKQGYPKGEVVQEPAISSLASIRSALQRIGAQRSGWQRNEKVEQLEKKQQPAFQSSTSGATSTTGWKKLLDKIAAEIASAPKGSRNDTLNRCAFYIGQRLAVNGEDEREARNALMQAALQAGLEPRETEATIESGFSAGKRNPAPRPIRQQRRLKRTSSVPATHPSSTVTPAADVETELLRRLARFPLTDSGNAEALVELVRDKFLFDATNRCWRIFDNGIWAEDHHSRILHEAKMMARLRYKAAETLDDPEEQTALRKWAQQSENARRLGDAVRLAQTSLSCLASDFDQNRDIVVTANGYLIHLPTGTVREARPEDRVTLKLGAPYIPDMQPTQWQRVLHEIYGGDQELIAWLQRAIGYSLTGHTREQCVFLLYGSGANGKSLILSTIQALMGHYSETAPFVLFDAEERINSDYLLAQLRGKRMITIAESSEDRRLHEARLKSATGEDSISARNPYGRPFTYQPAYKIWLAMNHLPVIRGGDTGIWRRLKLIEHRISFDSNRDVSLRDKLSAPEELGGILNWAIAGAIQWYRSGLGETEAIRMAVSTYREESDQIGRWLEERCRFSPDISIASAVAYRDYRNWCESNGEIALSITAWGERLTRRGFPGDRASASGRRERIRKGFTLIGQP